MYYLTKMVKELGKTEVTEDNPLMVGKDVDAMTQVQKIGKIWILKKILKVLSL